MSKSFDEAWKTLAPELERKVKEQGGAAVLAPKIGQKYETLLAWLKLRNPPRLSAIMDLVSILGLADMNEIMTQIITGRSADSDIVNVKVYDVWLAAGDGQLNDRAEVIDTMPFSLQDLQRIASHGDSSKLAIFEARGDSMTPNIHDQDRVMIDLTRDNHQDGIYAFVLFDEARIKRFNFSTKGVKIISDNPDYGEPDLLSFEETNNLHILGRVVWRTGYL